MKKLLAFGILIIACSGIQAQKKNKNIPDLSSRANDHFVCQLSSDHWAGAPDSINDNLKGLSRGLNAYFMLDKPFKTNPRLSVAFGLGISTSNIFFDKMTVDITGTTSLLSFQETDSVASYKKYKLNTAFLEVPVELRFSSKPDQPNKSIKAALGVKVGTLLSAHTKGKTQASSTGLTLIDGSQKLIGKKYFNTTRLSVTARVNYGILGVFGSYSLTSIFKTGVASENIRLYQVGLCLSGL